MYKYVFAAGRRSRKEEKEESLEKGLLAMEVCNSNDHPFNDRIYCSLLNIPEVAPAVFLRDGLHKADEILSKYPETSQNRIRPIVIRFVESASGVEPRATSHGLLFASTEHAKLELMFGFLEIYYEQNGDGYVRQVHKWWRRRQIGLIPLDPGLIEHLAAMLDKAPDLFYYIAPPNELTVSDYYAKVRLVFENGKLKERRGKIPLSWYIGEESEVKRIIQP